VPQRAPSEQAKSLRLTPATIKAASFAPVLSLLLFAQAGTPPAVVTPNADRFDLATVKPRTPRCDVVDWAQQDVLVCARRPDDPKSLAAQADTFEAKPFRPATGVLGGEGSVAAEQRATIMGSAPALMARWKLKF